MQRRPYFEQEGITLYHGDSREILPALGATGLKADLCLADPPYGDTSLAWDQWPDGWIGAASAAIVPSASLWCFGSMRMFLSQRNEFTEAGWRFAQEIVWEKHNGSSFHADRFKRVHELAAQFVRTGAAWGDIWKCPQFTNDATKFQSCGHAAVGATADKSLAAPVDSAVRQAFSG